MDYVQEGRREREGAWQVRKVSAEPFWHVLEEDAGRRVLDHPAKPRHEDSDPYFLPNVT